MYQQLAIVCLPVLLLMSTTTVEAEPPLPENLALKATATASAQIPGFEAPCVVDGKIVTPGRGSSDKGASWSVGVGHNGETLDPPVELTLTWSKPVKLSEFIYFGRPDLFSCWGRYEVYLDDAKKPVAAGELKMAFGPQRMAIPETTFRTVRFKVLSCFSGGQSGAAEIMAFAKPLTDKQLEQLDSSLWTSVTTPAPRKVALPDWFPAECRRMLLIQRNAIYPYHVYSYHAEGLSPGGALWLMEIDDKNMMRFTRLLDSPDGVVLDIDLDYDAEQFLFSWKRRGMDQYGTVDFRKYENEFFNIFRMKVDGSEMKRLTPNDANYCNPSWLPDGGIAFTTDRKPAFAYCWTSTSPVLHRMEADGSRVIRLSANYLTDFTPHVTPAGKILYSRWEYVDRPAIPIQSLWTISPDGTGLSVFFGNRTLNPATFMDARYVPGTHKVLCVLAGHNGPARGAIALVDRSHGPNAPQGIKNLTPEINPGRLGTSRKMKDMPGLYECPLPVDGEYFVVSRHGEILVRNYEGDKKFVLQAPLEGLGFYSPTPIRKVPRPPVIPSVLPKEYRPELFSPAQQQTGIATIHMQDVYVGLEPTVKRGEVKQLAVVYEIEKPAWVPSGSRAFGWQFPAVSCGATYAPKHVCGLATVEEDGSANFEVPAGLPIYFMALDAEGRAVQRMRSFTHLMPYEKQSCVGCHADRNTIMPTPSEERQRTIAAQRPVEPLKPVSWGNGPFSFPHVVQPVLDKYCVSCHGPKKAEGRVDLSGDKTDFFSVSYDTLARQGTVAVDPLIGGANRRTVGRNPYTSWISTYNGDEQNILMVTPKQWGSPVSRLADLLLDGHPDAKGKPRVEVPDEARRRVFMWIDLNVPYYDTSLTNHPYKRAGRRLYPAGLDGALEDVRKRRCASCHKGIPRKFYTRILNPENCNFMLAPLATKAGGTQKCGEAVFESKDDPDYQKILRAFDSVKAEVAKNPRKDMVKK